MGPAPGRGGHRCASASTGPVVAGSLGSGAGGTYAVTGDTVNTAVAPAQRGASRGSVLVSAATLGR